MTAAKELAMASFRDIDVTDKNRVKVIKWLKNFYDEYDGIKDLKGLYLHGPFGSGKTYLISALLNELKNKKRAEVCIIYFQEVLRELKDDWNTYVEKTNYYSNVPILLLDDIGAEQVSEWGRDEVLGTILQNRMNKHLITFFTSNLTMKELEYALSTTKSNVDNVKARRIIEEILETKTELLPNYLNVTLTPSNPLLHPARLYGIFKDYSNGKTYDKIPLFYEEWDDFSSDVYIKCDNELHDIIDKLEKIDLSKVIRVLPYYESTDNKSLTRKINSIKGFKGITTPSKKVENGYIPDLSSRYFCADIPYGLLIIKDFGLITNTKTPMIDEILYWYQKLINKEYINENGQLGKDTKDLNLPSNFGINTIDKIYEFYN